MTLGIAHRDRDSRSVLDCLREAKPPFPPSQVCAEFAAVLRSYRCSRVVGDRYAGSWPAEALAKHGIAYEPSERNKSQIYVDSIPLINSRRASLLDEAHLIHQLCSLERRAGRGGGRDVVDHPKSPHAHDDLSNAAMGAIVLCGTAASLYSEALKTAIGDAERPHQRQGMAGLIQHIEFYRRLGRPY
jgi:hypothetical protein